MWKRIILWVLTFLWATLIFCFSAQPAMSSRKLSTKISSKVVQTMPKKEDAVDVNKEMPRKIHQLVRKTAHLVLYIGLGALLAALCRSYLLTFGSAACISFFVSALYAATDEWHQSFIPGRSGQVTDVLLDSLGAAVGILLLYVGTVYLKKIDIKK